MKIIIIGAGIAGLTLALAANRAGIDVKLYEKSKALRNIGGGAFVMAAWYSLSKMVRVGRLHQAIWPDY